MKTKSILLSFVLALSFMANAQVWGYTPGASGSNDAWTSHGFESMKEDPGMGLSLGSGSVSKETECKAACTDEYFQCLDSVEDDRIGCEGSCDVYFVRQMCLSEITSFDNCNDLLVVTTECQRACNDVATAQKETCYYAKEYCVYECNGYVN